MRDAGLPRHQLNRAEVGKGKDVRQPSIEPALDLDDVAHRRSAVDGPAEGDAVFDRAGEPVDQDVTAAFGADQVRVADPNDVDALRHELGSRVLQTTGVEMSHPNLRALCEVGACCGLLKPTCT